LLDVALSGHECDESSPARDERRSVGRDVADVLEAVRQIAADIAAGNAPPDSGELHEIARSVLRGDYPSRGS
jgi:hypothetical protein